MVSTYTYEERLLVLKLDTLKLRREIYDLSLCYQIMNKKVDLSFDDFFEWCNQTSGNLRGHYKKVSVYYCLKFHIKINLHIAPVFYVFEHAVFLQQPSL